MIDFTSASLFDKLVVVCGGGMVLLAILIPLLSAKSISSYNDVPPQTYKQIKSVAQQLQEREARLKAKRNSASAKVKTVEDLYNLPERK